MTNTIALLGLVSPSGRFSQPADPKAFFAQYPHEVRSTLILHSQDRDVAVGGTLWQVAALLRPQEIDFLTRRIELELSIGPWIAEYHQLMAGRATKHEFFGEMRKLILHLLREMRSL